METAGLRESQSEQLLMRTSQNSTAKKHCRIASRLYLWGSFVQNKDNLDLQKSERKKLYTCKDTEIEAIHCGRNHAGFLTKRGELYLIGANEEG